MKRCFSFQTTDSPSLPHLPGVTSPRPTQPCTPRCFRMSRLNVLLQHLSGALEEELPWRAENWFSSFPALSLRRCWCLSHSPASAFPIFMLLWPPSPSSAGSCYRSYWKPLKLLPSTAKDMKHHEGQVPRVTGLNASQTQVWCFLNHRLISHHHFDLSHLV